jgi:hypothetical protein
MLPDSSAHFQMNGSKSGMGSARIVTLSILLQEMILINVFPTDTET